MRGQRRPTKIKILEGERNKNRINYNEPEPEGKTTAPSFLNKHAKSEWRRLSGELERLGLLTRVDRSSLAAYCQVYGRWVDAENRLNKLVSEAVEAGKDPASAFLVFTLKGGVSKNPLLTVINDCLTQMHEYLTEFGMTPVSRSKITANPKPKETDPIQDIIDNPIRRN